jgi:succinate dehydrogenase flavin-adding protein (antitoxin of CptAB toxin-antitoxin module)
MIKNKNIDLDSDKLIDSFFSLLQNNDNDLLDLFSKYNDDIIDED